MDSYFQSNDKYHLPRARDLIKLVLLNMTYTYMTYAYMDSYQLSY